MITLSPSQQKATDAFRSFLQNPDKTEFLLSGFAGSGKSFLVTYLIDLVRDEYKMIRLIDPSAKPTKFHFTATTNKAANVLNTMVAEPTKTIHSALGLIIRYSYGKEHLVQKNDPVDLNHSVLVIDESSMINAELLQMIRDTAKAHMDCKILYVGDSYQLPPVKEDTCSIFTTIPDSYFLTDIQRQAADSPIITFSHKYREILDDPALEWPSIPHDGKNIFHYTDKAEWVETLKNSFLQTHGTDDLRILAWSNDRVRDYNSWVRRQIGYSQPFEKGEVLVCNSAIMVKNNRVRARNDSLHTVQSSEPKTLFNIPGHQLVLKAAAGEDYLTVFQPTDWEATKYLLAKISKAATAAKKRGDTSKSAELWKGFWMIKNEWGDLRPLHAQTVHKSQGSTFQEVFIDVGDIAKNNKWYEVARLMYVAITRASHKVHLYGNLAERYVGKNPMDIMRRLQDG